MCNNHAFATQEEVKALWKALQEMEHRLSRLEESVLRKAGWYRSDTNPYMWTHPTDNSAVFLSDAIITEVSRPTKNTDTEDR